MNYYLHDSTGKIIKTGSIASKLIDMIQTNGNTLREGIANLDDVFHEGQLKKIPPAPNEYYQFDHANYRWVPNDTEAWVKVKTLRNSKLLECDWTQLSDVPEATKLLWQAYRQSLRDITDQPDPHNIVWPVIPQ